MVRDSINPEKEALREQIKRDTEIFLAKGGKIKQADFGVMNGEWGSMEESWKKTKVRFDEK